MSLAMSEKVARENGEIIACTRDGIATLFSGTARSCTAKAVFSIAHARVRFCFFTYKHRFPPRQSTAAVREEASGHLAFQRIPRLVNNV